MGATIFNNYTHKTNVCNLVFLLPEIYVWASGYVSASASGLFISLGLERERRGRRKGRKRKERAEEGEEEEGGCRLRTRESMENRGSGVKL